MFQWGNIEGLGACRERLTDSDYLASVFCTLLYSTGSDCTAVAREYFCMPVPEIPRHPVKFSHDFPPDCLVEQGGYFSG